LGEKEKRGFGKEEELKGGGRVKKRESWGYLKTGAEE